MLIPLFPRPPLQPSRTVIPHGDYGVDLIAMGGGASLGGETQVERARESSETMQGPVFRPFFWEELI